MCLCMSTLTPTLTLTITCVHCSRCRATSLVRSSLSSTERLGRDDDLGGDLGRDEDLGGDLDLGGSDGGGEGEAADETARSSAAFSACRRVEVEVWAEV
jgi:hypothetical protein